MLMPWAEEFNLLDTDKLPQNVYFTEICKWGFVKYYITQKNIREKFFPTTFITGASFIIRIDLLTKLDDLFDPLLITYSEDLELSLQLRIGDAPAA